VLAAVSAKQSANSWKTKSFLSGSVPEPYTDAGQPNSERSQCYKRSLECSDSEIDDNDDYASFRGKKQSKKKVRIEANRARNVSPSGSEVTFTPGRGIVFGRLLYFFVSLSATLRENGRTDLREIFREGVE